MDLLNLMLIGTGFLFVVFLILLILLIAIPPKKYNNYSRPSPRKSNVRKDVSSDLNRIKEQINGDSEEEW